MLISTGKPKANRSTPIIRQQAGRAGGGGEGREASVLWREPKIHLPQLINEEAIADEFSNWEQVS